MIPGYLRIGNVPCHIFSDTSLFMSKIRAPLISMVCPFHIHVVSKHRKPLLGSSSDLLLLS